MNDKPFLDLEQEWYAILKKQGFTDCEDVTKPDRPLKSWHNHRFKHVNPQVRRLAEDYYSAALALLITYEFKKERDRLIWNYHCHGISKYKISQLLKISNHGAISSDGVYKVIRKIALAIKKKNDEVHS